MQLLARNYLGFPPHVSLLTVLVTISGMGFTYVAAIFESALLVNCFHVESIVQHAEQHFNKEQCDEIGKEDVIVPSP